MNPSMAQRHRLILAGILSLTLLLPLTFFLGPRTIDHFLTTRYADQMLHHEFHPTEWPQSARFGLLLPLAFLQGVFGVNPGTAAALTIAFSIIHVLATYVLTRVLFSREAALVAAAISTLLPLETIQATLLYPDLPAAALATAGIALLVSESKADRPSWGFLILAGVLFSASYLVKQTVLFYLLFVGAWILYRRLWRLWPAALPLALTIAVETLCLGLMTGDPFFRQVHINRFVADKNYHEYFSGMGFLGISSRFLSELLNPLDRGFPYLIGIAAAYGTASWRFRTEPQVRFLFILWLSALILTTFWPVRWTPFVPALITDGRHLAPLIAPMAAVLGHAFLRLPNRYRPPVGAAFAAACLLSTALTHQYLAREDAGDRAAYRFLKEQGATRIRAMDNHGNSPDLLMFLSGYSPGITVQGYSREEMDHLKGEWVVVNDRTFSGGADSSPSAARSPVKIPPSWECVWKNRFPDRWDPRSLIHGDPKPPEYDVRVFRAP